MADKIRRSQNDSAWKDVLDAFFPQFMEFFYPTLACEIDWSAGFVMMEKELQQITSKSMTGKRFVDKLVKVTFFNGEERIILLHIEVQGVLDEKFPLRMYTYHYKLFDHHQLPILSLAVLTDKVASWRPQAYEVEIAGRKVLTFCFETVKLLDYQNQEEALKTTANIFGIVVWAQLKALATKKRWKERLGQKLQLTKYLLSSGRSRDEILKLLSFIDWVMRLPRFLELRYTEEVKEYAEEKKVSYITSFERFGMEKGVQKGEYSLLLRQLERKFKKVPENYRERLAKADAETLLKWGEELLDAQTLEEFFLKL